MSRWGGAYLVSHLGTGVNVEAQVVVGQLGGLFLQLPGESDLPEAERQVLSEKKLSFLSESAQINSIPFFIFYLFIFAMLAHFSTFGRAASLSAWNSPMVHNHICNLHSCKAILYAT